MFSVLLLLLIFIGSLNTVRSQNDTKWAVTIDLNSPDGTGDIIIFGEAPDANDGPPADSYDYPKPPVPMPSYVRAWFNNGLPDPYTKLGKDYRHYPGVDKTWDLYVQWVPSDDTSPTNITMSWSIIDDNCEYYSILMYNDDIIVSDMIKNNSYSFTIQPLTPEKFQIICNRNNTPPNIPYDPVPEHNSTNIDINNDVYWTGSDPDNDTVTYDVFFGKNNPPVQVVSNQSKNFFNPGKMDYNTTYYWKIRVWDDKNTFNMSPIWKFTTESYIPGDHQNGGGSTPTENIPPFADASASQKFGLVGSSITLNGSLSYDIDGFISNWYWDFGGNITGNGEITSHKYSTEGTYNVLLRVTDNDGASSTDNITIVIKTLNTPPSKPVITGPKKLEKNNEYTYLIKSIDLDNDSIQYLIDWGDNTTNKSEYLTNNSTYQIKHTWISAGEYIISVVATDNKTISESTSLTVLVDSTYIQDKGYLMDIDGDGYYDLFYSNISKQISTISKLDDGKYKIDLDGDNTWDFIYDFTNDILSKIEDKNKDVFPILPYIIFIAIFISIILTILFMYYFKK